MKTEIKTMELYVSPMRERNIEKLGEFSNQCICCGKEVKGQHKVVYMGTDWMAYNTTIITRIKGLPFIADTGVEIQGAFPIGNDCAKKMKGFTF